MRRSGARQSAAQIQDAVGGQGKRKAPHRRQEARSIRIRASYISGGACAGGSQRRSVSKLQAGLECGASRAQPAGWSATGSGADRTLWNNSRQRGVSTGAEGDAAIFDSHRHARKTLGSWRTKRPVILAYSKKDAGKPLEKCRLGVGVGPDGYVPAWCYVATPAKLLPVFHVAGAAVTMLAAMVRPTLAILVDQG